MVSARLAVSLFSGCGGFCEGIRQSGFEVVAAVEWDRFACQTYRANFPEVPLFEGDVHDFLDETSSAWRSVADRFAGLLGKDIDLLFGGPPCQGYSQIGTRILDDPRNELYLQYIRILKAIRPRLFLMENVPNMLLIGKGRFKKEVLDAFAEAGYSDCGVQVVTASEYGVPQVRKRAIFFGVRDGLDLGMDPSEFLRAALAKQERETTTAWDAIRDLPESTAIHYEDVRYPSSSLSSRLLDDMRLDRDGEIYSAATKRAAHGGADASLSNHHTKEIQQRRKDLIALLKPGAKGDTLPKEVWNGLRPEKWRRLPVDRPAYTILAQMHRDLSEWVHPKYERWITVREAARLQSFHDGFVFHSSEWQMLKQIGNAVPPLMAFALGEAAVMALQALQSPTSERESVLARLPDAQGVLAV